MSSPRSTVTLLREGISSEQHSEIAHLLSAESSAPAPRLLTLGAITLLRADAAVSASALANSRSRRGWRASPCAQSRQRYA